MRVPGTSLYNHPRTCHFFFFEAEISPCSVFGAIFTCVSRPACDCPRRIVKMPPMGFKHGKVVFVHDGTNSALRRVGVKGYAEMIKGAVVGIDLSSLLHGPLSTVDVKQVLTVNGGNSVRYLVASTLSDIFKAKLLATARAICLVCDPKRHDAHHCEDCKSKYTTAYAKKCSCTSRNGAQGRTDKARAAYTAALAAFNEEIGEDPDDQELRDAAGERLSAAFKKLMAATDTVNHALEDPFCISPASGTTRCARPGRSLPKVSLSPKSPKSKTGLTARLFTASAAPSRPMTSSGTSCASDWCRSSWRRTLTSFATAACRAWRRAG